MMDATAQDFGRLLVVLLSVALVPAAHLPAQETSDPAEPSASSVVWHEASALFPTRVVLPENFDSTRASPAVVALHGFAGSSAAFERVAAPFARAGYMVILPEGPYTVPSTDSAGRSSWALTTWTTPPLSDDSALEFRSFLLTTLQYVPSAVNAVQQRYQLGRVYVLGFSLGGVQALLSGFYNRERFDGIIAAGVRGFDRQWFTAKGDSLEVGSHLPVLIVQGRSDPMVPFSEAERTRDLLAAAGYDVELLSFDGAHELRDDELEHVVGWVEKQAGR